MAYEDDLSIGSGVRLFRRVHLKQIVEDHDTGMGRVSSGAFRDKEMSVNIESILLKEGRDALYCLENRKEHKLVSLDPAVCRRHGQIVCVDALPNDASHGLVVGNKSSRRINEGLRDSAAWVVPPTPPSYDAIKAEKAALGYSEEGRDG